MMNWGGGGKYGTSAKGGRGDYNRVPSESYMILAMEELISTPVT
jgi:hypothetical protein